MCRFCPWHTANSYGRQRMSHLFSSIRIGRKKLANRIVMGVTASGYALPDGFVEDALLHYYVRRAHGGVGLIVTEPLRVVPPDAQGIGAHIGIYADAFVPQLRFLAQAVHSQGARLLITLDEPAEAAEGSVWELRRLGEQFILAAWRALAANCDGVMLSAADGGVLHHLVSPQLNRRFDSYGGALAERLRLPLHIVEGIRTWMGNRLIIGFRIVAEDFTPGGISLQDARVIARRLVTAGVGLLDVTADTHSVNMPLARFPGWSVPLADGIKRVIPDVPVICSGSLGDPQLADSVIRDGSADLVMLRQALHTNPDWPRIAQATLFDQKKIDE